MFTSAPRVVLCLFGVVPRGIRHTWPAFRANVIAKLRQLPHVYVFNMDTGMEAVDGGVRANQSDQYIVPATYRADARQADADTEISRRCAALPAQHRCTFATGGRLGAALRPAALDQCAAPAVQ